MSLPPDSEVPLVPEAPRAPATAAAEALPEVAGPEGAAAELAPTCPINAEFLPPNFRKHVDLAAPVAIRMMGAKALVPMAPPDMLGALFMLTFDPDEGVRAAAEKSTTTLPDRILGTGLRDEGVPAPVLGYFLDRLWDKDVYAEMLILNSTTPDDSVARATTRCSLKILETISQNQLRILRCDDIIRQLVSNPNATPALVDSVCDFAVRSGVVLNDVPQMTAARVRLFGPEAAENPPDPGPTAEEVMQDFQAVASENARPLEERERVTLTQRLMKMNISQKIKLATMGNKEARSLLLRDTNKLVAVAAIRSPRITDGEVQMVANNRAAQEDVLRVIYQSREWTKKYPIKLALVKNPKTPLAVSMKFLSTLRESEIKDLARSKSIPQGIQSLAKKMMEKKSETKKEEK
jgi:hypothetical protein